MLEIREMSKEIKSVYGGQKFVATFNVEHRENGYLNAYIVKATVKIDGFYAELDFNEVVERLNDINKETLSDEGILELCNDERS